MVRVLGGGGRTTISTCHAAVIFSIDIILNNFVLGYVLGVRAREWQEWLHILLRALDLMLLAKLEHVGHVL